MNRPVDVEEDGHELPELPHIENEAHNPEIRAEYALQDLARRTWGNEHLDRALDRPQLTGIAFSGTVGIGIWINSSQLISIAGSAGCVISYIMSAFLVTTVMRCLAEMVSVRPFPGALMDFPATFVDPALGFAVGVTYWLSQCISMACLTSASVRVAGTFYTDDHELSIGGKAGITMALLLTTLFSNACGVKLYGNLERVFKILKIILILFLFIFMIAVNLGAGGPRMGPASGNYTMHPLPDAFRPGGFDTVNRTGENTKDQDILEIPGSSGQLLAIWTSVTIAVFSCMGGDMVVVAAGEARLPRRDLAPATRYMYLVPLICYILLAFVVGFNINFADPDLLRIWSKDSRGISHSPFIIVLKTTRFRGLTTAINACFLFSAYTAANTGLYVSSRTLFSLAQRYGTRHVKTTLGLGRTNAGHTPIPAIIFCSILGCISFICLADETYDLPITVLGSFFVGGVACVYASECVAFIRFKKGLDRLHIHDKLSRNELPYTYLYYRAHWQPLCAYVGLVGCILLVLFSGWVPIYILSARGGLGRYGDLKSNAALIVHVVGSYSGPIIFFLLYFGYKFYHGTRMVPLRNLNEDVYLPAEFAWDKPEKVELHSFMDWVREIWSFTK